MVAEMSNPTSLDVNVHQHLDYTPLLDHAVIVLGVDLMRGHDECAHMKQLRYLYEVAMGLA